MPIGAGDGTNDSDELRGYRVPVSRHTLAAISLVISIGGGLATAASYPEGSIKTVPEASINKGQVSARPSSSRPFRGWGMSLAWEANDLYGGDCQVAQIKDPAQQSAYMDLLFGDPATRLTLGFNIARYNIGGGDDPAHTHMRPDAQMEGYQSGPGATFDWSRDAPQRRMLQEAKKRGADIFEADSYSPPYWMTLSGCSSGSKAPRQDNLRPEMRESFVNYLATVVTSRGHERCRFLVPDRDVANPVPTLAQRLDDRIDAVADNTEGVGSAPVDQGLNQYVGSRHIAVGHWRGLLVDIPSVSEGWAASATLRGVAATRPAAAATWKKSRRSHPGLLLLFIVLSQVGRPPLSSIPSRALSCNLSFGTGRLGSAIAYGKRSLTRGASACRRLLSPLPGTKVTQESFGS